MDKHEFTYPVKVTRIVDGDTVYFMADCGLRVATFIEGRFARINAPEKNRLISRPAGIAAMEYLTTLLDGGNLYVKTEKVHTTNPDIHQKSDSWSRWIVEVYVEKDSKFLNINDMMVSSGHAVYKEYK